MCCVSMLIPTYIVKGKAVMHIVHTHLYASEVSMCDVV